MVYGEYKHALDAKNRVSIPSKMRDVLGVPFMIIRDLRKRCLRVYSIEEFNKYIEKLVTTLPGKAGDDAKFITYRDAVQATPDSLGRVLLPNSQLEYAQLPVKAEEGAARPVIIVGCGSFAEIWCEENYEARVNGVDMEALLRAMDELGL